MKKIVLAFMFVGLFLSCTSSKKTAKVTAKSGEELYNSYNCATCHGSSGQPVLAGSGDLTNPSLTVQQRIEVIKNGSKDNPIMVAFGSMLSDEEIKAIAEYTMSFVEL